MTKVYFIIGLMGTFLLTSCSVKTSSDTENPNLSKLKTYSWADSEEKIIKKFYRSGKGERVVDLNINNSFVEKELQSKGFTSENSKPDFLIRCKAFYEKEDNSQNLDWTKAGGAGRSSGMGGKGQNSLGIKIIPEKTTIVIIELLDPVSEEVIWRGVKTTVVGEMLNLTGVLEKDIHAIIKKIPSEKKK